MSLPSPHARRLEPAQPRPHRAETMQALVSTGVGKVAVEDAPRPAIGAPHEGGGHDHLRLGPPCTREWGGGGVPRRGRWTPPRMAGLRIHDSVPGPDRMYQHECGATTSMSRIPKRSGVNRVPNAGAPRHPTPCLTGSTPCSAAGDSCREECICGASVPSRVLCGLPHARSFQSRAIFMRPWPASTRCDASRTSSFGLARTPQPSCPPTSPAQQLEVLGTPTTNPRVQPTLRTADGDLVSFRLGTAQGA